MLLLFLYFQTYQKSAKKLITFELKIETKDIE